MPQAASKAAPSVTSSYSKLYAANHEHPIINNPGRHRQLMARQHQPWLPRSTGHTANISFWQCKAILLPAPTHSTNQHVHARGGPKSAASVRPLHPSTTPALQDQLYHKERRCHRSPPITHTTHDGHAFQAFLLQQRRPACPRWRMLQPSPAENAPNGKLGHGNAAMHPGICAAQR